jgi:uncharacterized protein YndB with AHSA1/START domain
MQDSSRVPPEYRFLDHWVVPYPIEEVYDAVGEPLAYPEWWHDVFLAAEGDGGPPEPGKRITVRARGFLPYRLRFTMECVAAERPTRIRSLLTGDFEGSGEWRLRVDDDVTHAELDWRPAVNKPLVRGLTPLLRPLFRANHTWTMERGQERILERLAKSSAQT